MAALATATAGVPLAARATSQSERTLDKGLSPNKLTALSAVDAVAAMQSGDIKAENYAAALLDRAKHLSSLNAFLTLRPDEVKSAAREADKRRAAGLPLGALHGLPIPVKDSINTKMLPTSNGTRALRGFMPAKDAGVLGPLFAQGAILMGKMNLHELSCGWTSNNATFGPALNPYGQARTPGGSSGGSAAAVAARMAPLAIGEDTYGSIRVPASFCGLAGLRPTFGRYPDDGVIPLSRDKFDQVGPLARSVADLVLFDSVVTGDHSSSTPASLKGVRIGISPAFLENGLDAQYGRIVQEAVGRIKSAGAQVVTTELPAPLRDASIVEVQLLRYELFECLTAFLAEQGTAVTLDDLIAQAGPNLAGLLADSRQPGSRDKYSALLRQREEIKTATNAFFHAQGIEALAFPPTLMPAFLQGDPDTVEINGKKVDLLTAIGRNVGLGSCSSLSCLVLPAGVTAGGLPVGLEFDAPSGTDRRLLRIGLALEKALGPIAPPPLNG